MIHVISINWLNHSVVFFLSFFLSFFFFFCRGLLCSVSVALHRFFSSCCEWGLLSSVVCGLLLLLSMCSGVGGLQEYSSSVLVACRLSFSEACGISPDQGLNPCPLHWQVDSYPLCHQGKQKQKMLRRGGKKT